MISNFQTAVLSSQPRSWNKIFIISLLLIVAGFCLPMLTRGTASAQDARVVTIYADGEEKTLATDAQTVGQALERAEIELHPEDLVEPAPQDEITTDSFKINVYRARPVLVVDGDTEHQVLTPYQSPRLIAEDAGLMVYQEDEYEIELIEDFVAQKTLGLKLTIDRSTPIKLNMYGALESMRTQAATVGEFIAELDLSNDEGEVVVRPDLDQRVVAGMTIHAVAVSDDTVAVEEPIQFERRLIRDTSRPLGYEEIRTAGQNGSKLVTYKVVYENGQEVSRKAVNSVVVEKPSDEVVVVGAQFEMSDAFARLRQCESGGNYGANTGNGFYGAYQFMYQTWQAVAPEAWKSAYPHEAPASAQDQAAMTLQQRSGWGQWPHCAHSLGLL